MISTQRLTQFQLVVIACASFLAGAALDFAFNGVFKIVWMVVYGPAYTVAAIVLHAQLLRRGFANAANPAVAALLAGTVLMHLVFTGRHQTVTYSMFVSEAQPLTLRSKQWPQYLIVISEPFRRKISVEGSVKITGQTVPVDVALVTDYGCVRTSKVQWIDGVDLMNDRDASWTWRLPRTGAPTPQDGPGSEDQRLPWCKIKFYGN